MKKQPSINKQSLFSYTKQRIKTGIPVVILALVYIAFCIGSGIYFSVAGQIRGVIMSFGFALVVPLLIILEKVQRVEYTFGFLAVVFALASGNIMGACYDVYAMWLPFDTLLHGIFGVLFALLGFMYLKLFIGEPKTNKTFFACLFCGFLFSMTIAVLWEFFEYLGFILCKYDMEEDELVTTIYSYFLSGNHYETVTIEGIAKTILYDAQGNVLYEIEGGYLDLGLIDTIKDMAMCFYWTIGYAVVLTLDWFFFGKRLNRWFIPKLRSKDGGIEVPEEAPEPVAAEVAIALETTAGTADAETAESAETEEEKENV